MTFAVDTETVAETKTVRAWDLPTRAGHWLLAALMLSAYVSYRYGEALGDGTLLWHRWTGYAILILMVFRLLWGFVGASTARFANFVRGPQAIVGYLLAMLKGAPHKYLGHNPVGGATVVLMLAAVLLQAGLGLYASHEDGVVTGPLASKVPIGTQAFLSGWHHKVFYRLLLPLIGLHLAANIFYSLVLRAGLVRAMVTGNKPAAQFEDQSAIRPAPVVRALVCLSVSVAVVLGSIVLLGGKLT